MSRAEAEGFELGALEKRLRPARAVFTTVWDRIRLGFT